VPLFVISESGRSNESNHLCLDESCAGSLSAAGDQSISISTSSVTSDSSSCGRNNRRHSFPLLSKSPSAFLHNHRMENRQTSDVQRSVSSSLNYSGCNSFGAETLPEQTENSTALRYAETTPNDARLPREGNVGDDTVNDSGYHNTTVQPVNFNTVPASETRYINDEDDLKKETCQVDDHGNLAASNIRAAKFHKPDSSASNQMTSAVNVVQRRASTAAKCQHCAADGDSRGGVVTRKLRRTSTIAKPQQQDKVTKTRRRHSFMLPNGSDIHPTRFSIGFMWPTIMEEDNIMQSTDDAESDKMSAKQFWKKCGERVLDAEKDDPFADLLAFRATLQNVQNVSDVDSSKLNAAPTSMESEFASLDAKHSFSADSRALGAKLKGDVQLADAESGQMNSVPTIDDCGASISDVVEEDTFADLKALGVELGKATSRLKGTPSPSPPMTHRPPSYDEALLHKALSRPGVTEPEGLLNCKVLTAACSPVSLQPDTRHALTSSTYVDATVTSAIGTEEGYRRPPPPYQLRPRRQNCGDAEIRNPRNSRPVQLQQRLSSSEKLTGTEADRSEGLRLRKNNSEPAAVRVIYKRDQNSPDLHRSRSFPSPRRRRPADSAQKENVCVVAPLPIASVSPRSTSTVPPKGSGSRSPAESVGATKKRPRNSMVLKRRSLTVKDRDWHRELVDQYSSGAGTSRGISISTTACV